MTTLNRKQAAVLAALVEAAEAGRCCPTQDDLLEAIGNDGGVSSTVNIVQQLERKGLIRVDRFQRSRRVTILATGKSTADPMNQAPHWRDRQPRPREIPSPSTSTLRQRAPDTTAQIFARASQLGVPVAEYLADLVWKGWLSEQREGSHD